MEVLTLSPSDEGELTATAQTNALKEGISSAYFEARGLKWRLHLELVNSKCTVFHQDNARLHVSLMTTQKLLQLGWGVPIHLPLYLQLSLCFCLYKFLLMEKTSIPWKTKSYLE